MKNKDIDKKNMEIDETQGRSINKWSFEMEN